MFLLIVYASTARRLYTDADLTALLATARRNNAQRDITGMLLYGGGSFLQVLEGPEVAVRERFARIVADSAHKNVDVLLEDVVAERQFGEWSMGFPSAGRVDPAKHPGVNRFLQGSEQVGAAGATGHDALDFLRSFRDEL
jgi:hypothetical protein